MPEKPVGSPATVPATGERENVFRITVLAEGKPYVLNPEFDLRVSADHLNIDMGRHAAMFCWWAVVAAQAVAARNRAEQAVKDTRSELDVAIRRDAEQNKRRITDEATKNEVESNPKLRAAKDKYIEAEQNADVALAIKEAYQHRRDMLVGLGANVRAEMQWEPTIRKPKENV